MAAEIDRERGARDAAVGTSVERREDRRLLTGEARYVDDIQRPHGLHMAIRRSRYGHARLDAVETGAAEAMDGVVAVHTHADLVADGVEPIMPDDDPDYGVRASRPVLADDRVTHQGVPIAVVVATDRYTAHEAAEAIAVDAERLDAVVDVEAALEPEAPTLHEQAPDNVAFEFSAGDAEATEAAFAAADRTVSIDLDINRVAGVPMEPRATAAEYRDGHLSVDVSGQNVFSMRSKLAGMLGLPEQRITVRTPDVGGGFGVKIPLYPGTVLAAWAAKHHGRPVSWAATRTEAFQSTQHARRHHLTAEAALDADARITAIRVESLADVGGYVTSEGSLVPSRLFGTRLPGAYDIPAASVEVTGVFTNTTPLSAYRGAGRPEAAYTIERLASACARELGMDPVGFRRRNFIEPDQFPYETAFGAEYDSGAYAGALDAALETVDYDALRERQAALREEGRYLGIGVSTYIEVCGGGPRWLQGARVQVLESGGVVAAASFSENGQGHATSFAQVVADELGLPVDDIEVIEGDTDRSPEGLGTGGSTALAMGGNALKESAAAVREQARAIAAHELEATPEDLEYADGAFHVAGAPDRALSFTEVAGRAYDSDLPPELRGLTDTTFFSSDGSTTPFGTHVAVVEVDRATGELELERYVAVDDVGNQVNPMLLEGQIVGGVVQGLGQAYLEEARFDDNGTLVTGSLQDYAIPKATNTPDVEWDSTVTPSPNNPLGVKGAGEAGTIGAMPALAEAVQDALEPFDVGTLDMPMTPERLFRAIEADGA